jgi:hypothetical protein
VLRAGEYFLIGIRKRSVLADKVDDIKAESIDPAIEPKSHDIVYSCANSWVFPIEVGLFFTESVEVIFACGFVPLPCASLEVTGPIVWRLSVTFGVVLRRLPEIPVAVRIVLGLARLLEPLVLVTGVVHHKIQYELHATLVELVHERIDIIDIAIRRIDDFVVANIITLAMISARFLAPAVQWLAYHVDLRALENR